MLEEFQGRLAWLEELLGSEAAADLEEALLLYAAGSFTAEGEGLLDGSRRANLQQAFDLQLFQRILPGIGQRSSWTPERWDGLIEQLNGRFPRGHARARRIRIELSSQNRGDTGSGACGE